MRPSCLAAHPAARRPSSEAPGRSRGNRGLVGGLTGAHASPPTSLPGKADPETGAERDTEPSPVPRFAPEAQQFAGDFVLTSAQDIGGVRLRYHLGELRIRHRAVTGSRATLPRP